jgi:endonuclease/exonuclease/phosphatase family metal-dependent hydrolase
MRWLTLGLIAVMLLAYLSPHVPPDRFAGILAFLGLIYPILLLLHIGFLIFWGIRRDRYFFFLLICMLIGWSFLGRNFGLHFSDTSTATVNSLKVMTFNASSGRFFDSKADFHRYLKQQSPEILCLQETPGRYNIAALKGNEEQVYHFATSEEKRLTIASIYPIEDYGSFSFLNQANGILYADITIGEQTIRVYCIHLLSNGVTTMVNQVAADKDWSSKEGWRRIREILSNYRATTRQRTLQAEELSAHMKLCPHPYIICGDFNDVPQSYVYQLLAKNNVDHFQAKGSGIGSTFRGNIPFLRIDYILSSPELKVVDSQIIKDGYSDHYPIISYIQR